jgi:hypothetical protein
MFDFVRFAMLLRPEYLSQKLDRLLPTKDGGTLRTVLDARTYMLGLSKDRERCARWKRVAELLLSEVMSPPATGRLSWLCSWTPSSTCRKSRDEIPGRLTLELNRQGEGTKSHGRDKCDGGKG